MSQHSEEKLYCDFCGKPCGYKNNLNAHVKYKHIGEYLYSCEKDGNKIEGNVCSYNIVFFANSFAATTSTNTRNATFTSVHSALL